MCKLANLLRQHHEQKKAQQKAIMEQLMQQKLQEQMMKQQEDVAQRNVAEDKNAPIKDNASNNVKRRISALRIPLLRLAGTGTNLGEDVGYGLNLGGNG